ncbi:phage baseplate assembly protein [Morganella psychrotolerans]|uniref:Phage tail protein n=1 Tax=Morganella psychrotolerans TaxID=368603 RepID=A0A1B8HS24_9GAMM|nr:phage tail protein [Morganella psychrotolerans]OBU12161.1 phage tail protein [Morganella psychrotolerans]
MPMQNDDRLEKITLLVGGHAYSDWKTYRIDSDFLKAADAWQLSLGIRDGAFNVDAVRGAPVKVKMGDDVVLSGRIDTITRDISRRGITLSLSGRDDGGILIDCAAPVFSARQLNLSEVISSVVRPLGITRIKIQADNMIRSDRIQIEPGERAWDAVMKAAGSRGLWPWFAPDGTLIIGGPDYDKPPVADLILNRNGDGNNLISLSETRSIQGCFSELTLLAQSHASGTKNQKLKTKPVDVSRSIPQAFTVSIESDDDTGTGDADDGQSGTNNMRIKIGDPSVPYYRPQIITAGDVDNQAQLQYRAKKAMADARLSGLDITAEVFGHRTDKGELWEPGQRVRIKSELHGIDGIFFLMGRSFNGGRPGGPVTQLRFKEDGVWIPDVYTQKAKKGKKKKKGKDQLRAVNLEK